MGWTWFIVIALIAAAVVGLVYLSRLLRRKKQDRDTDRKIAAQLELRHRDAEARRQQKRNGNL